MAVAYQTAATTSKSSATGSTIQMSALPSGTADGDFLIAVVSEGGSAPSTTPPSGWTAFGTCSVSSAHAQGFYKFWHTGDPTSETFTLGAAEFAGLVVARFTGVHTTTPMDVTPTTATKTSSTSDLNTTAITPVTTGAMLVSGCACSSNGAILVQDASMNLIASIDGKSTAMAWEAWSGGSGVVRTWSNGGGISAFGAYMAALRPAPAGPTPVSGSDSGTISATEAQSLLAKLLQTDSGTISAVEVNSITQKFLGSDSGTISATESQAITILTPIAGSDSGTISAVEAKTIVAAVLQADSATLTATEAQTLLRLSLQTDSATLTATEAQTLLAKLLQADSGLISAIEAQALLRQSVFADSGTISAVETWAVRKFTPTFTAMIV